MVPLSLHVCVPLGPESQMRAVGGGQSPCSQIEDGSDLELEGGATPHQPSCMVLTNSSGDGYFAVVAFYSSMPTRPSPTLPPGYIRALLWSTRPHFFAVPAGAALAGASAAGSPPALETALVAACAGLGWGVGQLFNDFMDQEADRIDAPDRPAARGLLPFRLTLYVTVAFGVLLLATVTWLNPQALLLGALAAGLMLTYHFAKRVPLLGNLSHGALILVTACIGYAAVAPGRSWSTLLSDCLPIGVLAGAWAATYLEANYEKDRRGDAHAGYRTLPLVIGLRMSAVLRALCVLTLAALAESWGVIQAAGHGLLGTALLACLGSAVSVAWRPDERVALCTYRFAIHGAALGSLALGSRSLPTVTLLLLAAGSLALTELACLRSDNP